MAPHAGGCAVDLEGGEYRISKPLLLPEMSANMQFGHGSLVASPDFEGDFLFGPGPPRRLGALSVFHSKSVSHIAFVWARMALSSPK